MLHGHGCFYRCMVCIISLGIWNCDCKQVLYNWEPGSSRNVAIKAQAFVIFVSDSSHAGLEKCGVIIFRWRSGGGLPKFDEFAKSVLKSIPNLCFRKHSLSFSRLDPGSLQAPTLPLTQTHIDYLNCGAEFREKAGSLATKFLHHFSNTFTVLNCSQQWGLDWLHDWDEPFGYCSDCASTTGPNQFSNFPCSIVSGSGVETPLVALRMLLPRAYHVNFLCLGYLGPDRISDFFFQNQIRFKVM